MSAFLAGLFLQGGLALHNQVTVPEPNHYWKYDINETRNPYGILALGYDERFNPHWSGRIELRHESSLKVNDAGEDSIQLSFTWRPWGE